MNTLDDIVRYFDSIQMKQAMARLLAEGRKTPDAAPSPPPFVGRRVAVTGEERGGSPVWTLAPRDGRAGAVRILYLHGGAYYHPAVPAHWTLMCRLVERLDAEVFAPDYPLTPEHTCRETFAMLELLYASLCRGAPSGRFVVMGDSAGGGLTLALCQYALEAGRPQPERAVLLSPWLDVTMSHPDIPALDRVDPFLEPVSGREIGRLYAGGDDPRQYRISPLYGPVEGLAPIALFTGTRDILNADARALARRLEAADAPYRLLEYPGMIHTWMLFPIPEGVDAFEKICLLLEEKGPSREKGVDSRQRG